MYCKVPCYTQYSSFCTFQINPTPLSDQCHPELLLIKIWDIRITLDMSFSLVCMPISHYSPLSPPVELSPQLTALLDYRCCIIVDVSVSGHLTCCASFLPTLSSFWSLPCLSVFTACHSDAQNLQWISIAWDVNESFLTGWERGDCCFEFFTAGLWIPDFTR